MERIRHLSGGVYQRLLSVQGINTPECSSSCRLYHPSHVACPSLLMGAVQWLPFSSPVE